MAGVYISYPFCGQKCTYCNFASGVFPAEIERGPSYEFVLNHTLEMERPADLFRVSLSEVANAGQ